MVKPQPLQRLEEGQYGSIATTLRPAHSPLYSSWRVNYRFRQRSVAGYVFHPEGSDANDLVFVNQFAGQLGHVVHPAIGDFRVESGDL